MTLSPFVLVNLSDEESGKPPGSIVEIATDAFQQAAVQAVHKLAIEKSWAATIENTLVANLDQEATQRTIARQALLTQFAQMSDMPSTMPSDTETALEISVQSLLRQFAESISSADFIKMAGAEDANLQRVTLIRKLFERFSSLAHEAAGKRGFLMNFANRALDENVVRALREKAVEILDAQKLQFLERVFGPELKLNEQFVRALDASAHGTARAKRDIPGLSKELLLTAVFNDLQVGTTSHRVGIIDMDSWIAELGGLINRINGAQGTYTLFDVRSPMPAGMVKSNMAIREWAKEHSDEHDASEDELSCLEHVVDQMFMEDFLVAAAPIREHIGVHTIIGITPARVAGLVREQLGQPKKLFIDDFSAVQVGQVPEGGDPSWVPGLKRVPAALLSTSDLREFAARADRKFEVAIGVLLVGALIVADTPSVNYHDDTGCVFDRNEGDDRKGIVKVLELLTICDRCKAALGKKSSVAEAMVNCLGAIPRPSTIRLEEAR